MLAVLLLGSLVVLVLGYMGYSQFVSGWFGVDDSLPTPAHTQCDMSDYVPTHPAVLFGHHFSSIAGAAPIVGPVIAVSLFGWFPALLWILLGTVFIGGVHDFGSLIASIRHQARSIAEIANVYLSWGSYRLFLVFIWLAMVYVLTVFMDLTAVTFVQDGGVASSSGLFILLAVGLGVVVYRLRASIRSASLIFVPLVFLSIWLGQQNPLPQITLFGLESKQTWALVLTLYCFVAACAPVWAILQPRDYLSSYLLYASVGGGALGILLGGFSLQYPAVKTFEATAGPLFPILFVTIACGACSGFHSIVASGTTSKQLDRESHARPIGYGAMLVEGLVAVIALVTVAMLAPGDGLLSQHPLTIYGTGMGKFLEAFGLPFQMGYSFGLLALSTFMLTTLDTATRLARFILQEFCSWHTATARYLATLMSLTLPAIFVMISLSDPVTGQAIPAWRAIWPVFGASNQLLGALALLVVSLWLKKTGRRAIFTILPMCFMLVVSLWALGLLILKYGFSAVGIIAAALLVVALFLIIDAGKALFKASH